MNEYGKLTGDKLENHFSNFLRNNWSFSGVSEFINNPKAFEMKYIYNIYGQNSAASVAGNAYHTSLQYYFEHFKEGKECDIIELQEVAFDYIENIIPENWKIQKTTPTIEECIKKATITATKLINNFYAEKAVYENYIDEVLGIEEFCEEWITVNGVDIPLPCRSKIDLIVKTKSGKISVIDHKSKTSFTDEKTSQYVIGQQAITYALTYESKSGIEVDEICFIENKHSKNKNGSNQLKPIIVELTVNTRRIYEYFLYEALRNMLIALQDPDYVYPINYRDNLNDFNVLFEFAADTLLDEVDTFKVADSKKDLIAKRQKKIKDSSLTNMKIDAVKMIKKHAAEFIQYDLSNKDMTKGEKIEHTFKTLGVTTKVEYTIEGYSSDTFLLEVNAGVKISSLFKYRLDIARALSVSNVRMMQDLIVYEGKSYFIIEASKKRERDLCWDLKYIDGMKLPIGVDNFGNTIFWDLNNHASPHMLVGGSTGSGKTVFLVSILEYAKRMGFEKIIVFDPKYRDFKKYHNDPKVDVYNDIEEIEFQIGFLVEEMNDLVKTGGFRKTLIICDEYADLAQTSKKSKQLSNGEKTLSENTQLLLQKSRALGFNIVIATQRSSVKIINGDIKVNLPIQVCFRVNKEIDSKVIIDETGGESLAGYGDGLIKSPEYFNTVRFQAFYKK